MSSCFLTFICFAHLCSFGAPLSQAQCSSFLPSECNDVQASTKLLLCSFLCQDRISSILLVASGVVKSSCNFLLPSQSLQSLPPQALVLWETDLPHLPHAALQAPHPNRRHLLGFAQTNHHLQLSFLLPHSLCPQPLAQLRLQGNGILPRQCPWIHLKTDGRSKQRCFLLTLFDLVFVLCSACNLHQLP